MMNRMREGKPGEVVINTAFGIWPVDIDMFSALEELNHVRMAEILLMGKEDTIDYQICKAFKEIEDNAT